MVHLPQKRDQWLARVSIVNNFGLNKGRKMSCQSHKNCSLWN